MTQQYLTPSSHEKLAKAAAGPLSRLTSQTHVSLNKKINTILQIVLHELAGQAWHNDTFWKRPDTCSESIFYKWKRDDPDFTPILDEVRAVAMQWRVSAAASIVSEASLILQEQSAAAAKRMGQLMNQEDDLSVARLAAADILNRLEKTAPQQGVQVTDAQRAILDKLYGGDGAGGVVPSDQGWAAEGEGEEE